MWFDAVTMSERHRCALNPTIASPNSTAIVHTSPEVPESSFAVFAACFQDCLISAN